MLSLRCQHRHIKNAVASLEAFIQVSDEEFVQSWVMHYLSHESEDWTMFEAVKTSIQCIEEPAIKAKDQILQIVGIGDDWHHANKICQ